MEKVKLNDGTLIEIQSGCSENKIEIITNSVDEVFNNFTDENLARIEFLTETDEVCAIYFEKYMKKVVAEAVEDGFLVKVELADANEIYKRVTDLEKAVGSLVNTEEETEEVAVEELPEEVTETEEPETTE